MPLRSPTYIHSHLQFPVLASLTRLHLHLCPSCCFQCQPICVGNCQDGRNANVQVRTRVWRSNDRCRACGLHHRYPRVPLTTWTSENAGDAEERDFIISILRTNLNDVNDELSKGGFSRSELVPLLEQKVEIEAALQLQEDYALAASLNGVEVANRDLIVQAAEDEENALADRELAARLARMDLEVSISAVFEATDMY